MSPSFDKEQQMLDRLKTEIPAFRAMLQDGVVSLDELLAHRALISQALQMIKQDRVPELETMYEQLAFYGLELVHLNLQVVRDAQQVDAMMALREKLTTCCSQSFMAWT